MKPTAIPPSTDAGPAAAPLFDSGPQRSIPGFVDGRRQPTWIARLRPAPAAASLADLSAAERSERLARSWREVFGADPDGHPAADPLTDWTAFVRWLGGCAVALMRGAQLVAVDPVRVGRVRATDGREPWTTVHLPVPPGVPAAARQAWDAALLASATALRDAPAAPDAWRRGAERLKPLAPRGANTPRFLRAAFERAIPVTPIGPGIYQYGHGRHAQWFDSTFTLRTSTLAAGLARDKQAAARRLRQAGLPVPEHRVAANADQAVAAAEAIGWPVVVKPADRDGGEGVAAGLETEAEVRAAYARARAASARVLVERHVEGRDYRLTVLDGELVWAIERVPAGVVGDGARSVEALVEQENADPRRGDGQHAPLKRLQLDDEARQLLARQSLLTGDVPAAGRFVRLRRIANIAAGGRPVPVLDQVHPDNAALAVRAARALRLDLAGIDLLIPDVARSWRETGAAICEVNAQPQIGSVIAPHIHGELLARRLGGDGRIPVVAVIGAGDDDTLVAELSQRLRTQGFAVGWSSRHGAGVDDDRLVHGRGSGLDACRMLLTDPGVDALVLDLHDDEPLRAGLPVDRFDWLVVAGPRAAPATAGSGPPAADPTLRLLAAALPACAEQVVVLSEAAPEAMRVVRTASVQCPAKVADRAGLLKALVARWRGPGGEAR